MGRPGQLDQELKKVSIKELNSRIKNSDDLSLIDKVSILERLLASTSPTDSLFPSESQSSTIKDEQYRKEIIDKIMNLIRQF